MATEPKVLYEFGPFRVDPDKQVLLREEHPVALAPKAFETLLILVRHSREVVTKDELMKAVWPDAFVEEANLSQNIFVLRKALGDTPEAKRYIITLPGRGYRFAAEVRTLTQDGEDLVIASRTRSEMVIQHPALSAAEITPVSPERSFTRVTWYYLLPIAGLLALVVLGAIAFFDQPAPKVIGTSDSVLVADFANATGDPVFDGSLRQGLEVQLEQSTSLRFVSEDRIQRGLAMMGQPPNARLTPQIARELCQRTQSAVVINGSILQIGAQYLLTVKAVDCANGESLASAEERAGDKNRVLDALGKAASGLRNKLGESLNTVQKYDTPLEQATTPSLEALQAYSLGRKAQSTAEADAIPFYKRAIELDPNFALAYAWLGIAYTTLGEPGVAAGYTARAYQLREQASEPEKYFISAIYNKEVTGNIEQAEQTCKRWMQAYPRADMPHVYLSGALYPIQGEYEKAVHEAQEGIRLNPDNPISYAFLIFADIALGRLDDAKAAHQQALQRKLDNALFSPALYQIAFLRNDAAEMALHSTAANGQPGIEDELLSLEADTAAYSGHLRRARENSLRAVDSAKRAGEKETAATYTAISALREALIGSSDLARKDAAAAMQAAPGRDAQYGAALALAYAHDERRVQALIAELEKRFPEATIVQFNYLPTLRAKLSLNRGNAAEAIELLKTAAHFELGQSTDSTYGWTTLYPVLVRGEAFLFAHQGNLAAAEFQKILDHPGILLNSPIAPLARLGLARAYLLQGDTAKSCVAYQDFLKLWKDADPDLLVLLTAKAEYANRWRKRPLTGF